MRKAAALGLALWAAYTAGHWFGFNKGEAYASRVALHSSIERDQRDRAKLRQARVSDTEEQTFLRTVPPVQ